MRFPWPCAGCFAIVALLCALSSAGEVRAARATGMELYPTPLAIGIEIAYSGDEAGASRADFVWRKKGESQWHNGVDMTFDRKKRLVWASIWPLEQGTTVEVKATFKPSADAKPQTLDGTVTTRTLILEAKGGRTFYVSPSGDDGNPGTRERAFKTLQHAADTVRAGDTVYAMSGVYKERYLFRKLKGTEGKPIVFMAAPGQKPIIDGSTTIEKGKGAWRKAGKGIYSTALDVKPDGKGYLAQDGKRMFRCWSLDDLKANKLGVPRAWFFDDKAKKLFIMPGSGVDPEEHEYKVVFADYGVSLQASQYVVVRGFEVRYFGSAAVGITEGARGCIVIDNVLHHAPGAVVMSGYDSTDNVVWRNDMYDEGLVDFTWSQIKASEYRRQGLTCATGRGSSICYNRVHEFFDCLDPETWQMVENIERNRDLDVMYNELYNSGDDAIEADGGGVNMRIHGNHIRNAFSAISIAPVERGPVYVTRNEASYKHLMLKLNVGDSDSRGWAFVYHNSGYCVLKDGADAGIAVSFPPLGFIPLENKVFRNNAFLAREYAILHNCANYSLDYDCYYGLPGQKQPVFSWDSLDAAGKRTTFDTRDFAQYVQKTGSELHGLYADPGFVSTPDVATVMSVPYEEGYVSRGAMVKDGNPGDLRLESTSPCIDRGVVIRGINEDFKGKAPDVGAVETR